MWLVFLRFYYCYLYFVSHSFRSLIHWLRSFRFVSGIMCHQWRTILLLFRWKFYFYFIFTTQGRTWFLWLFFVFVFVLRRYVCCSFTLHAMALHLVCLFGFTFTCVFEEEEAHISLVKLCVKRYSTNDGRYWFEFVVVVGLGCCILFEIAFCHSF